MKRSFLVRLFLSYCLIVLSVSALIVYFSFQSFESYTIEHSATALINTSWAIASQQSTLLEEKKYNQIKVLTQALGLKLSTRITVISPDGKVIADSEHDPNTMDNHGTRPEVLAALSTTQGYAYRYSKTLKENLLYAAVVIRDPTGRILGVIRLSLHMKSLKAHLYVLLASIIRINLLILVFSLVIAFFISRKLTHPLRSLIKATQQLSSGDFNTRIHLYNQAEYTVLAQSFNDMVAQLQQSFTDVARQKDALDGIIASMREGLVVIDRQHKIVMANAAFKDMINQDRIEGKYYVETLRQPEVFDLIRDVWQNRESRLLTVELLKRAYICSITFLPMRDELLCIFHDITELRKIEKIKKDFVTNVSHELRTPLTAIFGFSETLLDMVPEPAQRYLNIIKNNSTRLISMVEDLLVLSELESSSFKLDMQIADLKDLVRNVTSIFEDRIIAKGIALTLDVSPIQVMADSFRMEQVLINLLDNAVKYTDRGSIKISISHEAGHALIRISDTGQGIPPQDLDRIFERFYVVDKARTRKLGGTGLGLSIVKHIMLLHNGDISVQSVYGEGTTFLLKLPLENKLEPMGGIEPPTN